MIQNVFIKCSVPLLIMAQNCEACLPERPGAEVPRPIIVRFVGVREEVSLERRE